MTAATAPTAPALPDGIDELLSCRLAIVTGKGGVGKTSVAAALALAAAESGRWTLLVEVEGRQSLCKIFRTAPWDYRERQFRTGLWGTAIDPEASLLEYLDRFYGAKTIGKMLSKTSAIEFITTGAPGLRDLLLVGKLYEMEQRRRANGRPHYDLIIVDAPPTGRIVPFLQAPEAVTEIVRVGPIKNQSRSIVELLRDPRRTTAFLVTLLEEMPVTEATESAQALREAGIRLGPVFANMIDAGRFTTEEAELIATLGAEGLAKKVPGRAFDTDAAACAVEMVAAHRERLDLQMDLRAELTERAELPIIELPLLTGETFEEGDLLKLANAISNAVESNPAAATA